MKFWPFGRKSGPTGGVASVRGVNYSSSPLLASRTPPWRSRFVVMVLGLAFFGLVGRALWIQGMDDDFYLDKGEERYAQELKLVATRGSILDRNGNALATSVYAPTLVLDAKTLYEVRGKIKGPDPKKVEQFLAIIKMTPQDLARRIEEKTRINDKGERELPQYVLLRRQLESTAVQNIRQLGLRGVVFEPGFIRRYPEGEAAAHVVGVTGLDANPDDKNQMIELGKEGIELVFEDQLRGKTGRRGVLRDGRGRVVEQVGEMVDAQHGRDVQLTIDSRIQALAYQRLRDAVTEHRAQGGSVVVLDAQSGEVLAMANYPSYHPEERRRISLSQVRNRAVSDVFEPGSTVKPFVVSLGLEKGLVRPDDVLETSPFRVANLLVNDGDHGRPAMSVSQIIQKSSNVGTAKIALRLDNRDMGEMYARLGFGAKPAIGFNGTAAGKLRPWQRWKPIEKTTMSYGYGLSASLLQIARAYTALARDGELAPLSVVMGEEALPAVRVFQPEAARTMRTMLRGTVSPEGTAPRAQPVGYSAGGKTGTAKKLERGSYNSGKYRAWFAGMAPIERPRVVVAVMVDEPVGIYYGGLVAAPVFKAVVEQALRTLNVPPDLEVKPQVVAQSATTATAARMVH